jgi:hypothetical protein
MTLVDRIAEAQSIEEVFGLVNDFIGDLRHLGAIDQIPQAMRPARISTDDDLSYWLMIVWDEIKRRDAAKEDTPAVIFSIHAVLVAALRRLRSGWYH